MIVYRGAKLMSTFGNIRSILSTPANTARDLHLWDTLLTTHPSVLEHQGIAQYVNDHLGRGHHSARFSRRTYHDALFRGDYSSIASSTRSWELHDGFFDHDPDALITMKPPLAIVTDDVHADAHLIATLLLQCDLSELRYLSVRGYHDDLHALVKVLCDLDLPSLRALDLSSNQYLRDVHVRDLSNAAWFSNLLRVDLSDTAVGDHACRALAAGEQLAFFGLAYTSISDEGLADLIQAHGSSIRGLDLLGTSISEHSLPAILWGEFVQNLELLRLGSEFSWPSDAWCDFLEGVSLPVLHELGIALHEENSGSASVIARKLTSSSYWPRLERFTAYGPAPWPSALAMQASACKHNPTLTAFRYKMLDERLEEIETFFALEMLGKLEELGVWFGDEPTIEYDDASDYYFYHHVTFDRSLQIQTLAKAMCMQFVKRVRFEGRQDSVSDALGYLLDPRAVRVIEELECDVADLTAWRFAEITDKRYARGLKSARFTHDRARDTWKAWLERELEEEDGWL